MTTIPDKLLTDFNRFILIDSNKRPLEKEWVTKNNYLWNDEKLIKHLNNNGNYGVATGYGNLIVIDFDNQEYQDKLVPLLPETFTIKTGSGKYHLYYQTDNPESFKIVTKDKVTIMDIQGKGKQVVGCGSLHPNGNRYIIEKDIDINYIQLSELKAILYTNLPKELIPKQIINDDKKEKIKTINRTNNNPIINEIKKKYTPKILLSELGINVNHNPTKCPLHANGGRNLSFNDDVWHCFNCEEAGDVITLYQKVNNVDFMTSIKELCSKLNIEFKQSEFLKMKKGYDNTDNVIKQIQMFCEKNPFFYDISKNYWLWNFDNNKWDIVDEIDIINLFRKEFDIDVTNDKIYNKILKGIKLIGREKKPLNPSNNWIQFKNYVINIENNEKFPPSAEYFFTNPINLDIGESEETPVIDKLFEEWVGKDNIITLYEIIAYCLYRDYPIHRVFYLVGSGRNGKSKYLELISRFIGSDNRCTTDIDLLLDNRFEVTKLYKKLVCILGEANYTAIKKSGLLKRLSGQDPIGFEFKNKKPFDDYNYAKIIISTNSLPQTFDKTDGYYRRQFVIEFNNKFPEGKDILSTIPEIEYNNLALKSIRLLKELIINGKFVKDLSIDDKKRIYEEKSNPYFSFLLNECERDESYEIPFYIFYDSYITYLNQRGYNTHNESKISVSKKLSEDGFETETRRFGDKTNKVIIGLRFKRNDDSVTHVTNVTHFSQEKYKEKVSEELVTSVTSVTINWDDMSIKRFKCQWNGCDDFECNELLVSGIIRYYCKGHFIKIQEVMK